VTPRRVVVIEGEDAAPEAVRPTVRLLEGLGLDLEFVHPPIGQRALDAGKSPFPPEAREAIDASDATLFGSTSGKSALALLYLRWGRRTYANVRPALYRPGYRSPLARPEGVDLVIVRENLEDLYVGIEGDLDELAPLGFQSLTARQPVAEMGAGRFALKIITEEGADRVGRFAFELARWRKALGRPGRVTSGTKHNMLPRSDGLFRERVERVSREYPDIEFQSLIVDDLAHRLVAAPDVLSDAAAALIGGLGLAASGCYGDDYAYFESAHGTAPDLAGLDLINPTATLLSAALMLDYLDMAPAGERIERALARVYAEGTCLTPDQGGRASTTEFCEAVARAL
jgi:isocitrate/isopropylmalate dehydrogenase